ncbi:hypothetical protein [Bergeyella sp. RCAD1439]|uniref:hypothetical protein n=1 Tax=Bergeyella anatis TaxID=3113737 RepID=UPI002E197F30|nr:hypothetical protein [Bergeyella sp. RCAD1439]
MKFILLTILSAIIFFFVWNILKRMFFSTFYQFPKPSQKPKEPTSPKESGLKWDAETVEYEEIKETKQKK